MNLLKDIGEIHIIGSLFIFFAWSRVLLRYRERSFGLLGFILWTLIWATLLVVLYLPETTEILARRLGIGRGADLAIYISIVVLFYLVYRIYVKIDSLEQEITKAVREESLKEIHKKDAKA